MCSNLSARSCIFFFQFYMKIHMSKNAKLEDTKEYTKLLRKTSFSLKLKNFCILPMAFNWLLALLQRVAMCCSKGSLLSISMARSFTMFSELIVRSLIFNVQESFILAFFFFLTTTVWNFSRLAIS